MLRFLGFEPRARLCQLRLSDLQGLRQPLSVREIQVADILQMSKVHSAASPYDQEQATSARGVLAQRHPNQPEIELCQGSFVWVQFTNRFAGSVLYQVLECARGLPIVAVAQGIHIRFCPANQWRVGELCGHFHVPMNAARDSQEMSIFRG